MLRRLSLVIFPSNVSLHLSPALQIKETSTGTVKYIYILSLSLSSFCRLLMLSHLPKHDRGRSLLKSLTICIKHFVFHHSLLYYAHNSAWKHLKNCFFFFLFGAPEKGDITLWRCCRLRVIKELTQSCISIHVETCLCPLMNGNPIFSRLLPVFLLSTNSWRKYLTFLSAKCSTSQSLTFVCCCLVVCVCSEAFSLQTVSWHCVKQG